MHRTTILLPEDLREAAESLARSQGVTFSEIVRRQLRQAVRKKTPNRRRRDPLFHSLSRRKTHAGDYPDDLAGRHDDYIIRGVSEDV